MSAAGKAVASVGDPQAFAFIRSSAKPFQLAPFVASGRFDAYDFPAPTEALAIMAASHSGEDRHARTVQALLRAGGLTRDVLACGTHRPFDRETADRLIRDSEPPSALRHNCSGKHAGMALHAKAAGWPVETYWQPDHPVQQAALDTVATLTDVARDKIALATDGCGVVTFGIPLRGLALAFARLADPSSVKDPELRVSPGTDPRRDDGPPGAGRRRAAKPGYQPDARRARRPGLQGRRGGRAGRRHPGRRAARPGDQGGGRGRGASGAQCEHGGGPARAGGARPAGR